jgi:hypothetical protein
MAQVNLHIGKIRSQGRQYPWEPGYVESIRAQCKDLTNIITSIVTQFGEASEDLILEALEPTFEKAKSYTPYRTGELRGSGYLEKVGFRGRPRVEMGFARGGFPHYAVLVHEDLNMYHNPPTQAKFLQRAVEEDIADIAIRIGQNYKKFMGSGSRGGGRRG